jgi:hypothetical protein
MSNLIKIWRNPANSRDILCRDRNRFVIKIGRNAGNLIKSVRYLINNVCISLHGIYVRVL